jgi:transcriptional regulator with XRE-family HTH domain
MVPFGEILRQSLADRALSVRTYATRVGRSHAFVSRVLAGLRLPPLDEAERWLNAVELTVAERERLRLAAHLAHCPVWIVSHLEQLQDRLTVVEAEVISLRAASKQRMVKPRIRHTVRVTKPASKRSKQQPA